MLRRNAGTAALAAMIVLVGCRPTTRADVMLSNVNVIDVEAGQIVRGRDVLIERNTIRHIFPHGTQSVDAAKVVDGSDRYVIPGLWDMHAHIRSYNAADVLPMFIVHGVTGIRDLGLTNFSSIQHWKRDIHDGALVGPRIISSGVIIE